MAEIAEGESVDVVLLAGGTNKIPLFPGNRPGCKALVELDGKPFIGYALEALRAARGIGRVLVVGPPNVIAEAGRWMPVEGIPDSRSLLENAWRGLRAAGGARVLFCNPDQPLLRTEMVEGFLARALPVQADLVSGWVPGELIGPYPETEHKFFAFGDGKFAHANLFLVGREISKAPQAYHRIEALYGARKSSVRFAWAMGPRLFLRLGFGLVTHRFPTLSETLSMVGKHFGLTLAPVEMPWLEAALDIDEPEDYTFAGRLLGAAPEGSGGGRAAASRPRRRAVSG